MKMMRTLWLLVMLVASVCIQNGITLTVDNQLVSARNDCFERIALEAMLPFEKAFRTEDTNSLKICKEKCIQAGEKCYTIAFGVHRRGNGTCQLSSEKMQTQGTRPIGTIFDPDFDLYARKTNCFQLDDNTIPSGATPIDNQRPPSIPTLVNSQSTPSTSILLNPTDRYSPPSTYPTQSDTTYSITDYSPYPTSASKDTPIYSSSTIHDPSTKRPASYPTQLPSYPTYSISSQGNGWSNADGDKIYFSHDTYPLYKYPMLYENNYPAPNQEVYYPGGYAQNAPTVADRYRPSYSTQDPNYNTPHKSPRPVFGLGYGNGYSYGTPVKYGTTPRPMVHDNYRPNGYNGGTSDTNYSDQKPMSRPGYDLHMDTYPQKPMGPVTGRPSYMTDYPSRYPNERPAYMPGSNSQNDYSTRPDPYYQDSTRPMSTNVNRVSYDTTLRPYGPPIDSSSQRPSNNGETPRPIYDSTSHNPSQSGSQDPYNTHKMNNGTKNDSEGNVHTGYNDDKTIATFFNPDDYWTSKPVITTTESSSQNGSEKSPEDHRYGTQNPSSNEMETCFRRVLAGKRVAPHWVRRTMACERVEDCMRECGHEKRFMCEGFNYRLDPSGHGQGDCELIEIPLAQMDLYSSPNQRDSSLLRHPDYDYYERDRNAPSSCRRNTCKDCSTKPIISPPIYYKPYPNEEHYIPPSSSGYGASGPERYRPSDSGADRYRPGYEARPDYQHFDDFSSHGYYDNRPPSGYGGDVIDRYDVVGRPEDDRVIRPDEHHYRPNRPDRWEPIPSGHGNTGYSDFHRRPDTNRADHYRPPYRPGPDYSPYRPQHDSHTQIDRYHPEPPTGGHGNYLDRDRPLYKKQQKFVPYLIGVETDWGSYGGSYGGSPNYKPTDYWGIRDEHRRKDTYNFNYSKLGGHRDSTNSIPLDSPPPRYGDNQYPPPRDRHDYRHQWTRRPGPDDCSVKTSEGFRLHKTAIKHASSVPTITECERLCSSEDSFVCHTYSYRYSSVGRENCMLCDRPINNLDYYVDIEPDRDFDIYSMSDDLKTCRAPPGTDTAVSDPRNSAQCFFRAIDATRFFKSIVRDSLTVRSIGQCELECIKSTKFTCRAFAFRYGQKSGSSGIIDNCQLSDWPVRDMDKERHLILDPSFDVYERASYGHGCEIQPIVDDKHKKLCYLGYGSPAKLLSTAIKKVISVPTESECKKECMRFRETTPFKCYSFSFGTHASTFNCEMSDLDQTELKFNIHYAHTHERDYWLFAWNPFDYTCRDKVNTIGGTRVNNDRRMDIFREPGETPWRHYTVSGKACREGSPCEKNLVTGFYSCETENGEIGSWDYCCKEDHPCGYSKGFEYPWCFVGDEPDQWRKCSDRYFPGNETHSSITIRPTDKKKHDQFQRPPRPGGLQSLTDFTTARLWPVTYLYSEGPPNSTEFSNFVDCNKETC